MDPKPTIFVSHSHQDKALATALVDLLQSAIRGLPGDRIKCTVVDGHTLSPGYSVEDQLRKGVLGARVVIALITPSSLASQYVMFELGARWGTRQPPIPLLAGIEIGELKDPLRPLHALSAHVESDLHQFVREVAKRLRTGLYDSAKWLRHVDVVKEKADDTPKKRDSLRILELDDLDTAAGTVDARLAGAEKEIWISGNDNAHIRSKSPALEKALQRNVKIRLLGVEPKSAAAKMLAKIDPRFVKDDFKTEISGVTTLSCNLRARYPDLFEYRLLPILPAIGYFITDPEGPKKRVKIELYTALPWKPINSRPHLVIDDSMPKWRDYFIQQFRNYWELSKSPCKPRVRGKAKTPARRSR